MNIAKGIKGIRNFLNTSATNKGWHVFTVTEYVTYAADKTALEIIAAKTAEGATFLGWTGNGLTFDK